MKVAYICADVGIPVFGQKGCSIHVQEIIRSLLAKNIEICLFTPRLGGEIPEDFQDVTIYPLPKIPKMTPEVREKMAYSINADLKLGLSSLLPFDLIYERYSLWSYIGMEFAKKRGITGILEVNAPLILEQEQHRCLINRQQAEEVAKRVFDSADYIVAVSSGVKDYVCQYVSNVDKVRVIPNGVNAKRFSGDIFAQKSSYSPFTVGFVGTLKPWHGLSILIESFASFHRIYSDSRLLIVGDGGERDSLQRQISDYGLESSVVLTGMVTPDEIPYWLGEMDVAVAPYPASDNFYFSPLKIYEYMAAGLPVIASEIGQITEIIDHEVNGLLSPAGDAKALTDALFRLLRSHPLRLKLGKSAREKVLLHHTWDRVVDQVLSLN